MNLADVRSAYLPRRKKKRLGRGWGSGHGKTCGHGNKGQQARSGGGKGPGFEGGQMPLYRRIPKRGFNNARFRTEYAIVNLGQLEVAFADGAAVDATAIRGAHLVNAKVGLIKILGNGELSKKLHVTADRFSESAKKRIEALGGSVTALNPAPVWKPKPPPPVKRPKAAPAEEAPAAAEAPAPAKGKKPKGPADAAAPEAPPAKKPKGPPPGKAPKDPPAAT